MNVNVLEFIKSCINSCRIHWTYHINMRLKGRSINRKTILLSTDTYEIIEEYPDDKYLPSYLSVSEFRSIYKVGKFVKFCAIFSK